MQISYNWNLILEETMSVYYQQTYKWRRWVWRVLFYSRFATLLSDQAFIKLQYEVVTGKRLNLDQPQDFNQKLQWLKLNYRNPLLVQCSDKYAVRNFVKERVGNKYLNDVLGVYSSFEDMDIDSLPSSFVLKATHGSGWNVVCRDKSQIDWRSVGRKFRAWLLSDYSRFGREWQYREIPHRIICEKYLQDSSGFELRDYKIFCFDGTPELIWVDFAVNGQYYRNFYDTGWRFQPEKRILWPNASAESIQKPINLDEMLWIAEKLSNGFPQVRVDLYNVNDRVVFGELTFSSASGLADFCSESFANELGSYIKLPPT